MNNCGLSPMVALVMTSLTISAYAQGPVVLPCHDDDQKCAAAARLLSPTRKIAYWVSAFEKPVEKRLGGAPNELVVFLNLDNIAEGFPNKPRTAAIPEDFLKDLNDAIADIPLKVRQLVKTKLAGIYFVEDLGGTGYTDYIEGGPFGPDAGFTVLDLDVLEKLTANAWASWKESTPFRADARYKIEAEIEAQGQDNRKNAIQYILLHELGHILSIGEKFHPRWDQPPNTDSSLEQYPFARLSWESGDARDRYVSRFEKQFPQRKDVAYYFGAKLDGDQMVEVYDQLEDTNYPTLYAATSPGDDFAESFVSYVHTVLLQRPLELRIYRDGKIVKIYGSCWEETRCAAKRKILEGILQ